MGPGQQQQGAGTKRKMSLDEIVTALGQQGSTE